MAGRKIATGPVIGSDSVDVDFGIMRSARRRRLLLAFKPLQAFENLFQEEKAVIDFPIPAVEFTEQEPDNCGPGNN